MLHVCAVQPVKVKGLPVSRYVNGRYDYKTCEIMDIKGLFYSFIYLFIYLHITHIGDIVALAIAERSNISNLH